MPDALTESFCERCGTRYEFAAPAKLTGMRRTRGVFSGLKNYILSQDSLSDSLTDGIRHQEETLAAKQLDAFHSSFNFCIDCRQYACTNCWNEPVGRCQSCQPLPEADRLAERFAATLGDTQPDVAMQFPLADQAWPASDLTAPSPEPMLAAAAAEPEAAWVEPEPMVAAEPEPEPMLAEPGAVWVTSEPDYVEPEPMVAEPEPVHAEPEPEPTPVYVEPEPVPVYAEAEVVSEPEPEPAYVEPEPIPYRPLRPISDTFLHLPRVEPDPAELAAAAAMDEESMAARRAQLDLLGLGDAGEGPVEPGRPVVLPYRSSGAAVHPTERQAAEAGSLTGVAFWDASAREVAAAITQIGVRSCGHCELSLSASARFCRRCGTPQSQSA
jgi:hypothetical protein